MRRLAMHTLAAAMLTAVLSFSGSVAAASSPTGQATDAKLCKALAKIGSLDTQFDEALQEAGSWDEARAGLVGLGPKINRAWRTVVRRIPDEFHNDARLVAGFTKRLVKVFADAESLEEASDALLGDRDAVDAGLASARLETFSQDTCDVSINNE